MRARTVANRPAMDAASEAGDDGAMSLSDDARTLWDAARRLNTQALDRAAVPVSGRAARALPPLLFFTDPERTPAPWETAARLPAGAAVVYRSFGAADAEATARRLRSITAERGVGLLIGLDAELAERVGADGVHLPERALSAAYALGGRRPDWLLTGAVHSAEAARRARDLDALVLSPVFEAGGASGARPALGVKTFSEAVAAAACPIYALGGVGPGNVEALAASGACGIAGVEAVRRAFAD